MKEIFTQYGNVLIACIVGMALLAYVSWIMPRMGIPIAEESSKSLQENMTSEALASNWRLRGMEGSFTPTVTSRRIALDYQHLRVSGKTGARTYALARIYDQAGASIPWMQMTNREYFQFQTPGIYTIYFKTTDASGSETYGRVNIPVQREPI